MAIKISPIPAIVYILSEHYEFHKISKWSADFVIASFITAFMFGSLKLIPFIQQYYVIINSRKRRRSANRLEKVFIDIIGKILTISTVGGCSLLIMNQLGFGSRVLLTIGGIFGVSIGFASRDLIGSIIGTIVLYWDKPFIVGDWVRIHADKSPPMEGMVERIDWRYTVISPPHQNPIYVPNNQFVMMIMENISLASIHRMSFSVDIYQATVSYIQLIINDLKQEAEDFQLFSHNVLSPIEVEFLKVTDNQSTLKLLFYLNHELVINKKNQVRTILISMTSKAIDKSNYRYEIVFDI